MRKGRKYRFYEKKQSLGGRYALIMAAAAAALFVVSVLISCYARGNAGIAAGAVALIGMLFAVCSFWFGVRSFREKDSAPGFSIAGTITGGVIMLGYLMIYLTGLR